MKHTESTWKTSDGVEAFSHTWEPEGDARAVVCLVHGLGEHSGRYEHVAKALNRAGVVLFSADLRGHGKTGGPRGHTPSFNALLDDIALLLQQASQRWPGKPLFLYGHSLGGNLVLNYALRRRPALAGVISTSPWLRLVAPPPALTVALARTFDKVAPGITLPNNLKSSDLTHDPAVNKAYDQDPLNHDRISARLAITAMDAGTWAIEHAGEFSLPLLLMHGGADPITSPQGSRDFAAKVKGDCSYQEWPSLYHETHNEPEQAQVIARLVEWVGKHL